jgi:predicted ATPase
MRFLRLHIENWRNFRTLSLPLQRRVFVIGPNASGKSNLLDVFRFLAEVAQPGGGLQHATNRRQGLSKIRCLAARRYPDVMFDVQIGDDPETPEWQYRLDLNQDNQRRAIISSEVVYHRGAQILYRPDLEDKRDPERRTQTLLEQVSANKDFRDIADFFASVRYLHIVPQLVRDPERSVGRISDPYGGDFLEQIARTPQRTLDSRLARITKVLQVAVPQLQELRLERDARGVPHLSGLYEHWRPKAGWQREDQFSDGTLRLLGLLWAVLEGSGPLLLEEPELSLHPSVIRYFPQMLARVVRRSGRQILLSTHSPEILSDRGIGLEEVILLQPTADGTEAQLAGDDPQIRTLAEAGEPLSETVMPRTSARNTEQLALFGDIR